MSYRTLITALEVGLLLPCNVTVAYLEDGITEVSLVNPLSLMGFANRPDLLPIAEEAHERLQRVVAALTTQR